MALNEAGSYRLAMRLQLNDCKKTEIQIDGFSEALERRSSLSELKELYDQLMTQLDQIEALNNGDEDVSQEIVPLEGPDLLGWAV